MKAQNWLFRMLSIITLVAILIPSSSTNVRGASESSSNAHATTLILSDDFSTDKGRGNESDGHTYRDSVNERLVRQTQSNAYRRSYIPINLSLVPSEAATSGSQVETNDNSSDGRGIPWKGPEWDFAKQDVVFFDDFSDPNSGWPTGSFGNCEYGYYDGRYRVKVSGYGQRCLIPNPHIPKQVNGTFSVMARRTSDVNEHVLYGLVFGAGTDATNDRWTLEVYPYPDPTCNNQPAFSLVALEGGQSKFFDDMCSNAIDTGSTWNELKVTRNGSSIQVYLNGTKTGEYNDANYLLNEGYSLLEVASLSDNDVIVEFDNFTVLGGTSSDPTPPSAITDLTTTPSTYPGDIVLSWRAPGDDGDMGTASAYTVKYWLWPIGTEENWDAAWDVEGEPVPLVAGTTQTMTVSVTPGRTFYFAIRAQDEIPENISDLHAPVSATAPGIRIRDINSLLGYDPSAILDQRVTVVAMPVRTDDWTLGVGDYKAIPYVFSFFHTLHGIYEAGGGLLSWAALVQGVLIEEILGNWLQMRAQLVWGMHPSEYGGDPTLLVWYPEESTVPLMDHGVPYVITGTVRKKTYVDVTTLSEDHFYYLEVEHSSDRVIQQPSTTHPHFTIAADFTYHNWEDIHQDGVTWYGDQICTIGMVTERYPLDGYHYLRIQLMERVSGALVVRVPTSEAAPDMGAMALCCGTKRFAGGDDLHPGWLPIARYLDTTTGQGKVEVLQGTSSTVVRHERSPMTFLGIEIGSPVDIHIYDSVGNHVGVLYDGSGKVIGMENSIPGVEYFYGVDDTPEFMSISNPTAGVYTVTIRGTGAGAYTQTIRIYDPSGGQTYASTVTAQPISEGQEATTIVDEIPAAPTGLQLEVNGSIISLDWEDNTESDLAGYNVYRSTQANGIYEKMNASPVSTSAFTDSSVGENRVYYYYVTAEDIDHNESGHLAPLASGQIVYLSIVLKQLP